jgi:23S rRNA (guanosine2251-2'-O)-methyltransferase
VGTGGTLEHSPPGLSSSSNAGVTANTEPVSALLEGIISIEAALQGGHRPINRIIANRDRLPRGFARIRQLAEERKIAIVYADRAEVDALANGRSHGGIVALAGERRFVGLEQLLDESPLPFLVMIDGIEDPFNFGQSVRSLYAAGATGLLLRPRNWLSAAGVVARSSAGASELISAAVVTSVADAHARCVQKGIEGIVLSSESKRTIFEHDLTNPLMLILGGEHRGITRSFGDRAVTVLSIPYGRDRSTSLGTAAAASIAAFEVLRQRSQR